MPIEEIEYYSAVGIKIVKDSETLYKMMACP
jgi:hypothetical protein